MSGYIVKAMYLKKPKCFIIWNGRSSILDNIMKGFSDECSNIKHVLSIRKIFSANPLLGGILKTFYKNILRSFQKIETMQVSRKCVCCVGFAVIQEGIEFGTMIYVID